MKVESVLTDEQRQAFDDLLGTNSKKDMFMGLPTGLRTIEDISKFMYLFKIEHYNITFSKSLRFPEKIIIVLPKLRYVFHRKWVIEFQTRIPCTIAYNIVTNWSFLFNIIFQWWNHRWIKNRGLCTCACHWNRDYKSHLFSKCCDKEYWLWKKI
jgi:hypothetical protein